MKGITSGHFLAYTLLFLSLYLFANSSVALWLLILMNSLHLAFSALLSKFQPLTCGGNWWCQWLLFIGFSLHSFHNVCNCCCFPGHCLVVNIPVVSFILRTFLVHFCTVYAQCLCKGTDWLLFFKTLKWLISRIHISLALFNNKCYIIYFWSLEKQAICCLIVIYWSPNQKYLGTVNIANGKKQ